jgi:hypothetical protein
MAGPPLSKLDLALIDDIAGFYADPLGFVRYVFPWGEAGPLKDEPGPDEWQTAYLRMLADKVRVEDIDAAVRIATACHPRLHAIDAKIETALVVMTEDERRQRARELIQEAFAERPLKLIEGEVIEADAAEALVVETESVGQVVGRAARGVANQLEDIEE